MRLKYWIKLGFSNFLSVLIGSSIFSMLMFIQTDGGWDGLLVLIPLYLLLFGALLMLSLNTAIYKSSVPLVISFGSTRNEVLLGLQISRVIPVLLIPALAGILMTLSREPAVMPFSAVYPLGIGTYLITSALGIVIGTVFAKYGKLATIAASLTVFFVAIGGGILAAFSTDSGALTDLMGSGKLPWLLLCIGLFLYSISMIPEHRTVWKCNVKL